MLLFIISLDSQVFAFLKIWSAMDEYIAFIKRNTSGFVVATLPLTIFVAVFYSIFN